MKKMTLKSLNVKSFTTSDGEDKLKGAGLTSVGGMCSLLTGCQSGGGMTSCSDSIGGESYCY